MDIGKTTTLGDAIKKAVETHDASLAGKVADYCRFKLGMSYQETLEFVQAIAPISESNWESLLYYADCGYC